MRVVLTNFGSTGSIYPYVALAVELVRHGHQAVLALPPSFASLASQHGVDFAPIGPDQRRVQTRINETMVTLPSTAEEVATMLAPLAGSLPGMYADLRAASAGTDILVSGPVQPAGLMVHETTGIPYVSIQNVHFASGGSPVFTEGLATVINGARRRLGLPLLRDPIMQANDAAGMVLFAMSRHVRPRPQSWPLHFHLTGYFFLEEQWTPDDGLAEFLASGPPPVVVTFGSMTHDDAHAMTATIIEAVEHAGCRAVIQRGWSGLGVATSSKRVRIVGFVPHDWLFARASLVVHHGGSGTTASVFRAGIPSVFVPHTWEQPIWAQLADDVGCAPPMIPLTDLTPQRLGAAIAHALETPSYHRAARELGAKIRAERGVQTARRLLEQLASHMGVN